MKKTKIIYWILTGLAAAMMLLSSIPDILVVPEAVTVFKHLGYPTYLLPFIGIAKLLGVIAILVPRFPRLKEWAYAGLVFDLVGAMYSHISVGDALDKWMPIFLPLLLLAGSYIYYHRLRNTPKTASVQPIGFTQ